MDLPPDHGGGIPIPISSSTYVSAHGHVHGHASLHDAPLHASNLPFPSPTTTTSTAEDRRHHGAACKSKAGAGAAVVYRECLKNHAASLGGKALDGCGEFMPGGADGTLEALRCSACSCHRNFHRKEIEGELSNDFHHHLHLKGKKVVGQKGVLISASDAYYGYNPASNSLVPRPPPPHQMVMPLGALQSSEWSDEMEGAAGGGLPRASPTAKKRFRTKFTPEQKEKMLGFAEKVGWTLQREEEGEVQQLCQEIGVKRRVLKVWMHNNKHNLAKKTPLQLEEPPLHLQ